MKALVLGLILGFVLLMGCTQSPAREYVCQDGRTVSNPTLCTTSTPTPGASTATPTPTSTSAAAGDHNIGELFAIDGVEYIVTNARDYHSDLWEKDGVRFSIYVKNIGMVSKGVGCSQARLFDSQHRQFDVSFGAEGTASDNIQPGMGVKLDCFAAMPQTATGLYLEFDNGAVVTLDRSASNPTQTPTPTPAPTPSPPCSQHTTCADCAAGSGCGWSISQNACKNGMNTGSTDGSSSGSDWAWVNGFCSPTHPPPSYAKRCSVTGLDRIIATPSVTSALVPDGDGIPQTYIERPVTATVSGIGSVKCMVNDPNSCTILGLDSLTAVPSVSTTYFPDETPITATISNTAAVGCTVYSN